MAPALFASQVAAASQEISLSLQLDPLERKKVGISHPEIQRNCCLHHAQLPHTGSQGKVDQQAGLEGARGQVIPLQLPSLQLPSLQLPLLLLPSLLLSSLQLPLL